MLLADYINKGKNFYKTFFNNTVIETGRLIVNTQVPSSNEIWSHQKQVFKAIRGIGVEQLSKANNILVQLNKDLITGNDNYFIGNFEENIQNIESLVDVLNTKGVEQSFAKIQELKNKENDINSLIQEYKQIYNTLSSYDSLQRLIFALKPIEQRLKALEDYINSLTQNSQIKPTSNASFNKRIAWCEYLIKGQLLEAEGKDYLKQNLPQHIVINTGSIYGAFDVMGNFGKKQMKEDIMIFDNPNLMVEYEYQGKRIRQTVLEFANFLEKYNGKDHKIYLTQEGYESLQSGLCAAVQAKATRANRLKFGQININTAKKIDREGQALMALKEIYKSTNGGIYVSHQDYDMLFNYNLAHNINKLLGNNTLLLTREGITDLNEYIYHTLMGDKYKKYFYATEKIHLGKNKGVTVAIDQI